MTEQVRERLREIEQREQIKILHCVESGSRAWGFASPDSDYDVRFVYVRPARSYLQLEPLRDVIEWELNDVWDINGWDLQKLLRLLYKSNPTIFEWDTSPIVYYTTPLWETVRETIRAYFRPKVCMYHYLSMARSNYRTNIKGDTIKYKKYFYILRPLLACRWILERNEPAPMLFSTLMTQKLPTDIRSMVDHLLDLKVNSGEAAVGAPIPALNDYIEAQLNQLLHDVQAYPDTEPAEWDGLNECFLRSLDA